MTFIQFTHTINKKFQFNNSNTTHQTISNNHSHKHNFGLNYSDAWMHELMYDS